MLSLRIISIIASLVYHADAKVYEKCELARELRDRHSIPFHQIGTYVCIAERQSNLNTEAVSGDSYFGLYQMGSEFWCELGYAGKACGVQCSNLLDDDITDDMRCVQIIFDEHQRLFNNGFHAWPSSQFCQSQGNSFIQECFIEDNQIVKPIKPFSRQETKSGNVGEGRVYERCELARELLYQHKLPVDEIATWVCIARYESEYKTSAIGRLNWDGSGDHGLFQISDIYWCGDDGKACGLQCSDLRNNDISDDVRCIKQIHKEHQRLSGDGFNAWAVYPRCKGNVQSYIDGCFDSENEIKPYKPKPAIQQPAIVYSPSIKTKSYDSSVERGKVYERCELAQELRFKHKIPIEQIGMWVCIAKHESDFNTSAIGRLNWDGSEDHGLFQISDIYWCGDDGKSCGLPCSKLEDNDITDDIKCMLKIYEEHTLLSGDGFNAWTVYKLHCRGRSKGYIEGCFGQNEVTDNSRKPQPAVTQPVRTTLRTTTNQPRTTTARASERTFIASTIKTSRAPVTSKPTTPRRVDVSSSSAKPFNIFDMYFNSFPRGSPKNEVKSQGETVGIKKTTTKLLTTTRTTPETTTRSTPTSPKSIASQRSTTSIITSRRTTTTTRRPSTTAGRLVRQESKIQRQTASTRRTTTGNPFVNAGKFSLAKSNAKPITTTKTSPKVTQKPATVRGSPTLKPFNLFDFYLNGFSSVSKVDYKPVQFGDRSTAGNKAPSVYNAFQDYSVSSNRVGRVVQNITPHSFDYLLKLTTPRTAFKRS